MTSKFRVAITGTHHTGKSTFISALGRKLTEEGLAFAQVSDLAVEARSKGFPILHHHTFESTAWIVARGMTLELEAGTKADVVLVDRPVADALGYLTAALRYRKASLAPGQRFYLDEIVKLHSSNYDVIYLSKIDPAFPWDTSKERDDDLEFRQMAEDGIIDVLARLRIPFTTLPSSGRETVINALVAKIRSRTETA